MTTARIFVFLMLSGFFLLAGCTTHKDLTRTAEVMHSGVLNQRLRTTQYLVLLEDKHSRTLFLGTRAYSDDIWRPKIIGCVEAGTELQVNKVVRVRELVAMLAILPEFWEWKCTLARIESGPHAGKEVALDGAPLGMMNFHQLVVATLGCSLLTNTPAMQVK